MADQTPARIQIPAQGEGQLRAGLQTPQDDPTTLPTRMIMGDSKSSAPATPNRTSSVQQHQYHQNAPPTPSNSAQRRASSQSQQRPGSSASPRLMRKTSRSSLGGSSPAPQDEQQKRPTPKRSISNLITELREAHATMEPIPEPTIYTAPEIAMLHFGRELSGHEAAEAETIVLLHDACYGHRYSRPKSTKSTLSMIVERPERLHAGVLGAATAYVRLGGHHAGARNAPHPKHVNTLSPPFKIRRTQRLLDITSAYVTNVHGVDWMSELHALSSTAGAKLSAGEPELARAPSPSGTEKQRLHEGDLYLCKESLDAFQGALGGVADAVDSVFLPSHSTRRAFVAVRPPGHHCSADYPSGFCWINNVHVGIEYAAQTHGLTHAAIIDFDLHHGDGSQSIAWSRNSKNNEKRLGAKVPAKTKLGPDIGYYSLHDINSYPCEMGDDEKVQAASLCVQNAHGQSVWNVHLQPWRTIEDFWDLYETRYKALLDKAREFLIAHAARIKAEGKQTARSAIFISAGFDASEWEGSGMQRHKVSVPTEFYARFTHDIRQLAEEEGTACHGRIISVLEGGYSDRALCSGVLSHLSALSGSMTVQPPAASKPSSGLGLSMQPLGTARPLDEQMHALSLSHADDGGYDSTWWSANNLAALEHHINPPPISSIGGKKVRTGPQPTYATPTESFAYKVIDPNKFARSISGTMREGVVPVRPASPPPPEVNWIVAAHELSKLLIPTDRVIRSCTAEELAAPKVKKERTSDVAMSKVEDAGKPRQLRTRAKTPATQFHEAGATRSVSNADRRRTIADLPLASSDALPDTVQTRRGSRRSSIASTVSMSSTLHDAGAPPVPALPPTASSKSMRPPPGPTGQAGSAFQVKKTRPAPEGTPSKAKKPPSTNAPSTSAPPIRPAPIEQSTFGSAGASTKLPTGASAASTDNSVEALASGMKRISLKVGTREESERKAKEKLDAERRARALKGAETRRLNKAARDAKVAEEKQSTSSVATPSNGIRAQLDESAALPTGTGSDIPLRLESKVLNGHPHNLSAPMTDQSADTNSHLFAPAAAAPLSRDDYMTGVRPESSTSDLTVHALSNHGPFEQIPTSLPYDPTRDAFVARNGLQGQTESIQAAVPSSTSESLPGNPVHIHPKDLPKFTSTGHIPFAAPIAGTSQIRLPPEISGTASQSSGLSGINGSNFDDSRDQWSENGQSDSTSTRSEQAPTSSGANLDVNMMGDVSSERTSS